MKKLLVLFFVIANVNGMQLQPQETSIENCYEMPPIRPAVPTQRFEMPPIRKKSTCIEHKDYQDFDTVGRAGVVIVAIPVAVAALAHALGML